MNIHVKSLLTAALIVSSTAAIAESRVCIGGNLDALTPAQVTACKAKSAGLRQEARLKGTPDWRFVVICDEAGWSQYASFPGNNTRAVMKLDQQTDAEFHVTFLRGSRLRADSTRMFDVALSSAVQGRTHAPKLQESASQNVTALPLLAFAQGGAPAWKQR